MVHLRVLGGLTVTLSDGRSPNPTALQPRRLAVLAMLARASDRGVSREKLMAMLWPDADEEAARRGLTQALYALRGGLEAPELCEGVQHLRLNLDVVQCDVLAFEQALSEGDLDRAAALHTGPFLDGFRITGAAEFDRWIEEERAAIAHRLEETLERLAQRDADRGNSVAAVKWWRRRAAGDPFNARVTVALMRALVASGDRAGAIAHARVYESLLLQELGAQPDADVVALAASLRAQPEPEPDVSALPASASAPSSAPPIASSIALPTHETPVASATPATDAAPPAVAVPVAAVPAAAVAASRRWRWYAVAAIAGVVFAAVWFRSSSLRQGRDTMRIADQLRVTGEEALEVDAAVSPDGKQVAYVADSAGELRLMLRQRTGSRAVTLAPTQTGDQRRPRWSPDGSQVLFEAQRGLWLVPALGGSPRLVVSAPSDSAQRVRGAAWSPDGKQLVWVQHDTVYRRAVSGGTPDALVSLADGHSLAWSPDGRWIAVYGQPTHYEVRWKTIGNLAPSSIVLIDARCGPARARCVVHELTSHTELNGSPEWRAVDELVFVSNRGGARDLFVQRIHDDGTAAGVPQRLTSGLEASNVSVASDGVTLAYSVLRQSSNVWAIPLSTSDIHVQPVQVTRGSLMIEGITVSHDGRWLAYDANTAGQQDIYLVPLAQGRAIEGEGVRVVDNPVDDFHPSLSPDGRWLAYYTFVDGVRRAAIVSTQGGESQLIHPNGPNLEEHTPAWTMDGKHLTYFRGVNGVGQLFVSAQLADGRWGPERQITTHGGVGTSTGASGELLYFSTETEMRLLPPTFDESASRVVHQFATKVTDGVISNGAWMTPDGSRIVVKGVDAEGPGFWWIATTGGALHLIARIDDVLKPSVRPEFTTDGRWVFYTRLERQADVWSMRLQP